MGNTGYKEIVEFTMNDDDERRFDRGTIYLTLADRLLKSAFTIKSFYPFWISN